MVQPPSVPLPGCGHGSAAGAEGREGLWGQLGHGHRREPRRAGSRAVPRERPTSGPAAAGPPRAAASQRAGVPSSPPPGGASPGAETDGWGVGTVPCVPHRVWRAPRPCPSEQRRLRWDSWGAGRATSSSEVPSGACPPVHITNTGSSARVYSGPCGLFGREGRARRPLAAAWLSPGRPEDPRLRLWPSRRCSRKGWFPLPLRSRGDPGFWWGVTWGCWWGLDRRLGLQGPCTIGVLHPLKQNEHLTVRGLREQVHGHSLDWPEGSTLDAVGWGPAEAVQDGARSVWGVSSPCRGKPGFQPPTQLHTYSTKLPMAARGLQET